MLYLSQVLRRPIRDHDGEHVAAIKDVVIRLGEDDHPPVTGFVARYRRRDFFLCDANLPLPRAVYEPGGSLVLRSLRLQYRPQASPFLRCHDIDALAGAPSPAHKNKGDRPCQRRSLYSLPPLERAHGWLCLVRVRR